MTMNDYTAPEPVDFMRLVRAAHGVPEPSAPLVAASANDNEAPPVPDLYRMVRDRVAAENAGKR
jgi:hypothetical protein